MTVTSTFHSLLIPLILLIIAVSNSLPDVIERVLSFHTVLVSGHDEEFSVASSQEFGEGMGSSQELGSTLTRGDPDTFQMELEALHQTSLEEISLKHNREVQALTDDYEAQLEELNEQMVKKVIVTT